MEENAPDLTTEHQNAAIRSISEANLASLSQMTHDERISITIPTLNGYITNGAQIGRGKLFPTKASFFNAVLRVVVPHVPEAPGVEVDDGPINEGEVAAVAAAINDGVAAVPTATQAEVAAAVAAAQAEVDAVVAAAIVAAPDDVQRENQAAIDATADMGTTTAAAAAAAGGGGGGGAAGGSLSVGQRIIARASAVAGWIRAARTQAAPTTMYSLIKVAFDKGEIKPYSDFMYKHPLYERITIIVTPDHPLHIAAREAFAAGVTTHAAAYDVIISFLQLGKITDLSVLPSYECILLENYFKYVYLYTIKMAKKRAFNDLYARTIQLVRRNMGTNTVGQLTQAEAYVPFGGIFTRTIKLAGEISPRELVGLNYIVFEDIMNGGTRCESNTIITDMGLLEKTGEGGIPIIPIANMDAARLVFERIQASDISVTLRLQPSALSNVIARLTRWGLSLVGTPLRVYDILTTSIGNAMRRTRRNVGAGIGRGAGGGAAANAGRRTLEGVFAAASGVASAATGPMARLIAAGLLGTFLDSANAAAAKYGEYKQVVLDSAGDVYMIAVDGTIGKIGSLIERGLNNFDFAPIAADAMLAAGAAMASSGGGGGGAAAALPVGFGSSMGSGMGGMGGAASSGGAAARSGGGGGAAAALPVGFGSSMGPGMGSMGGAASSGGAAAKQNGTLLSFLQRAPGQASLTHTGLNKISTMTIGAGSEEDDDGMKGPGNQGGGARRTRRFRHRKLRNRKTHKHRSTHKHKKHGRKVRFTRTTRKARDRR